MDTGERSASAWIAPGQPGLGQHGGVDAAAELAQLQQRFPGLLAGRFDECLQCGVGVGGVLARHPECQAESDQPLLRAVVQVPFQPQALGVACLDNPGARCPDLLQLGLDRCLQPGVLQCHAGCRRGQPDQLRLLLEPLVVH